MAVAYLADSFNQALPKGSTSAGVFAIPFRFALTAAFGLLDTVALTPIPGGAWVAGFKIWLPQLDTGAAVTVDVGDSGAGNSQLYITATQVGRSATFNSLTDYQCVNGVTLVAGNALNVIPINYAQATPLNLLNFLLTIRTAPAVGVATGKIKGMLYMQPNGVIPLT